MAASNAQTTITKVTLSGVYKCRKAPLLYVICVDNNDVSVKIRLFVSFDKPTHAGVLRDLNLALCFNKRYMNYKYYGLHSKVQRWNRQLSYYLKIKNQEKMFEAEKYIIQDELFISEIRKARQEFGINEKQLYSNLERLNIGDVYAWFDSTMQELGFDKEFGDLVQTASDICAKLNLPYGWSDYVSAYICLNDRPLNIEINPDLKIDIVGIEHDDSLIVRLENGLTRADYIAAWKTFDNYFKEAPATAYTDDSLKRRIFLDHTKNELTPSQLAKKYFPLETQNPSKVDVSIHLLDSRDRVKKIIRRMKKLK